MTNILHGDALTMLRERFTDESVQCCVTSPPYWGLRNYGVDGQLGLENTPEEYVAKMVEVFREVRRVLKKDGTLWLNLGDSYSAGSNEPSNKHVCDNVGMVRRVLTLKPKDLVGIPWRVAFALQADGWYLRSDIIWSKPNPMPESVTDRPTKAHEYLFLLSKSERYYYDAEAIMEKANPETQRKTVAHNVTEAVGNMGGNKRTDFEKNGRFLVETRNKRSVWTVATAPFPEAHFATFPPKLIEPCILAGCPPAGKQCDCDVVIHTPTGTGGVDDMSMRTGRAGMNRPRRDDEGTRPITLRAQREYAEQLKSSPHRESMEQQAGPAFAHYIRTDGSGGRPVPAMLLDEWLESGWLTDPTTCDCPIELAGIVLDPFCGSGTTLMVAKQLGRHGVGIELNQDYIDMALRRCQQEALQL